MVCLKNDQTFGRTAGVVELETAFLVISSFYYQGVCTQGGSLCQHNFTPCFTCSLYLFSSPSNHMSKARTRSGQGRLLRQNVSECERLTLLRKMQKGMISLYFTQRHFFLPYVHTAACVEASTLLPIHFEWGDVKLCRTVLCERRFALLALLRFARVARVARFKS